ncbi:enoyl-CoA delta isomerase 1, peroxisomal-like [Andrographis paniculata]|uniref:enoyl-CoA delta isomerase 1, peroxisomal-like n=1 Tax=Andrographis paniculata TaxID=175694 RepID=UPI0021E7C951|nr:enoyl-CoA delta isomerase 1, peroxisomal-like [Andrographis paniculata]
MCSLDRRGDVFILTITGDDEHRLNPTRIDSIRAALRRAKLETRPAALITTAQGKFFSNGYDLDWAFSHQDPTRRLDRARLMSRKLRLLVEELISLPMPTIAAVTGHASAAGFILALCHDYLLMRKERGFLYMSEVDIKFKISAWFTAIVKNKIASPRVWRDVILKAEKITADRGVEMGIVDSSHATAGGTLEAAVALGMELVRRQWSGEVYAGCRRVMFEGVLATLRTDETVEDSGQIVDDDDDDDKAVIGNMQVSKL